MSYIKKTDREMIKGILQDWGTGGMWCSKTGNVIQLNGILFYHGDWCPILFKSAHQEWCVNVEAPKKLIFMFKEYIAQDPYERKSEIIYFKYSKIQSHGNPVNTHSTVAMRERIAKKMRGVE